MGSHRSPTRTQATPLFLFPHIQTIQETMSKRQATPSYPGTHHRYIHRLAAEELCLEKMRTIPDPEENLWQAVLIKNTLILAQNTDFVTLGEAEYSDYEPCNKKWSSGDDVENNIDDILIDMFLPIPIPPEEFTDLSVSMENLRKKENEDISMENNCGYPCQSNKITKVQTLIERQLITGYT